MKYKNALDRLPYFFLAAVLLFIGGRALAMRTSATPAVMLPAAVTDAALAGPGATETAVFAGGCFWGIEAVFEHLKGVKSAESGYAGGSAVNPSYEEVSSGMTGHAESVRVVYDPSQVTYGTLLR